MCSNERNDAKMMQKRWGLELFKLVEKGLLKINTICTTVGDQNMSDGK